MINEKDKIENTKDKDSGSDISDHSLDAFHDNVSESEIEEENDMSIQQHENLHLEEVSAKIEMRCG